MTRCSATHDGPCVMHPGSQNLTTGERNPKKSRHQCKRQRDTPHPPILPLVPQPDGAGPPTAEHVCKCGFHWPTVDLRSLKP